LPIFDFKIIQK